MRKHSSTLHLLMAVLALVLTFGTARSAHADDRADARTHYQAGTKAYAASDYKTAIREFAAAQQLVPADLNSYNLALCYDKLGDAEPAVQYYREYLNKVPNTDKRGEIEASVSRLDAAAKSAAAKRAEDDRRADDAKRADDQRRLDDQRRADEARRLQDSRTPPPPVGGALPPPPGPVMGGAAPAPTGDAQLDRAQGIDINQIRGQRGGGGAPVGGSLDMRNGASPTPNSGAVPGPTVAQTGAPGPNGPTGPAVPNAMPGQPAAEVETPVYKKWWFWAVVGVSLYVVYEVATANSNNGQNVARPVGALAHGGHGNTPAAPSGLTLLRW